MKKIFYILLILALTTKDTQTTQGKSYNFTSKKMTCKELEEITKLTCGAQKKLSQPQTNKTTWYSSHSTTGKSTGRTADDLAIDTLVKKYSSDQNYIRKITMSVYKNIVKEKAIQILNAQRARQEIEENLH